MKSRTVNGIYVIVIVAAILLMLPFFVPYEDEGYYGTKAGYSLQEEEEPDTFMRIIDRVGSFYGIKRKRKITAPAESNTIAKEVPSDAKSAESGYGAPYAAKDKNGNPVRKNIDIKKGETGRTYQTVQYGQVPSGALTAPQQVKNNVPDSVEYKGKTYKIEPDAYGNQYIITDKGPVAVASALKNGGRLVNSYNRNPETFYSAAASYGKNGSYKEGRQFANNGVRKSGSGNGGRYKTGKAGGFGSTSNGGAKGENGAKQFTGVAGGNFPSNYGFDSEKEYENVQNTISANIGAGSGRSGSRGSSADAQSSKPKAYILQDATPSVGANPQGISVEEGIQENLTVKDSDSWDTTENNKQNGEKITVTLSDNYIESQGIMLQNKRARALMTSELIGNRPYNAVTGKETIPNPWIMPNDISIGGNKPKPGQSFYNKNMQALSESSITKLAWDESDVYYDKVRKGIQKTSGGSAFGVAIIDGQKNPYTMTTMPHDTFYYKTTAGLLNNRIIGADNNGTVNLNKIDKNNVIVVVPERNLADNLRKDGYKVALFEQYAVTPDRLKNFYGQTANAVKDIVQARRNDYESKKKDIAVSLNDIKQP